MILQKGHLSLGTPNDPSTSLCASHPTSAASMAVNCRKRKSGHSQTCCVFREKRLIMILPGHSLPVKPLDEGSLGAIAQSPKPENCFFKANQAMSVSSQRTIHTKCFGPICYQTIRKRSYARADTHTRL